MKKVAKILAVVMAVAMVAACFAGCGEGGNTNHPAANNTEFVIGVSGPLTGGASIYGIGVKNAAELAVQEINDNGGLNGVNFKLVAIDDMHDATKVATNYAYLYEESGMQVSLGCVTTAPGKEFKKLSKEDNVFFLTPSASGDEIPEFDNGYQMCFADGNQGKVSAEYVNDNFKGQTIGVFYKSDDPYSSGIFKQFKENVSAEVTVIETLFTEANTTDFSSQIDSLKDCKFIFMPIYYQPASIFMTQAKAIIAPDAVYYGCDGFDGIDSYEGFNVADIPQEISMLSHFNSKAAEGPSKEFIDKYVKTYGSDTLNQFAASAYDSVYAIYGAMKQAWEKDNNSVYVTMSASDLCEVLKGVFNGGYTFVGVTGDSKDITWSSNGFVNKTAVKYTVKEANK